MNKRACQHFARVWKSEFVFASVCIVYTYTFILYKGAGIGNFTWEWDVYNLTHPPPINTRPARNVIDGSEFYTAICARQNATLRQEVCVLSPFFFDHHPVCMQVCSLAG